MGASMSPREWLRPPRHLLVMFLAITLLLSAALGWLSFRVLQHDRALRDQQAQERRELATDLAATALEKNLSAVEEVLASLEASDLSQKTSAYAAGLPADAVLLLFDATSIEAWPKGRLLYYPVVARVQEPSESVFAAADALEFRKRDHAGAAAVLGPLARAADPLVRAAALVRLGRNHRKDGRWHEALESHEELRRLGSTPVNGLPAELIAREARCSLLEALKEEGRLKSEAAALDADLHDGRWQISRAAYTFYAAEAKHWAGAPNPAASGEEALALSDGAEALWQEWLRIRRGEGPRAGRSSLRLGDRPVLLIWRSSGDRLAGLVAGPRYLEERWMRDLDPVAAGHGAQVALIDAEGRTVLGNIRGGSRPTVRLASATRLPWTLQVFTVEGSAPPDFVLRRRLLVAGFCLVILLVLSGSYFIGRAVTRELEVARQQSDFVSAVSHEFRTPLTSLCQFTELLAKGRVAGDQDRQRFYDVLARETQRLRRLVEGLLNFGRIDAGVAKYNFERLDPAEMADRVVREFQQEADIQGRQIELRTNGLIPAIRGDREALGCVLWNLLDNAVKYSPEDSSVWVDVAQTGRRVSIAVLDQGAGIARAEQRKIFQKFVRGAAAKSLSVRGTGIGLAVARQIARAHGGELTVSSALGRGSTFTVLLPVAEEA